MSEQNLHDVKNILITRCYAGWTVVDDIYSGSNERKFCFESTDSLVRHLKRLIGESKWIVQPARDEKGHFKNKQNERKPNTSRRRPLRLL